jgi:hypothetical protein
MTTVRERTLSQVRAKVHRARMSHLLSDRLSLANLDSVRTQLVVPILAALGWNIDDADEVRFNFRLAGLKRDSGIALFMSGRPRVLIDVRGLDVHINHRRLMNELLPKAGQAGFEWLLLTDGNEYDIYNVQSDLALEHRAFDAFRISDDAMGQALDLFDLFSRGNILENGIESAWNHHLIDRQVKEAMEGLLTLDESMVELILSRTEGLSAADIRRSLARAKVTLQFGAEGRSQTQCSFALGCRKAHAVSMSDAELRIATWLQHRSIERWAKGGDTRVRSRNYQRRGMEQRRSGTDRRQAVRNRRASNVEITTERRDRRDRRSKERRDNIERRLIEDRRRIRRRA